MQRNDDIRLRHMLDAAREAVSFARGRVRGDLENDRQPVLSLVKDIEIVGEAATRVSESGRAQAPEIPWQETVAKGVSLSGITVEVSYADSSASTIVA